MPSPRIAAPAVAFAVSLVVLAGSGAAADTLMTLQGHRDGFEVDSEQQPAEDVSIQLWLGKDKVRRDDGKTAAILRADKNQLILVDHQTKAYSVVALPIDFDALIPAEARQAADMWKMTAAVTPSDETRKIGNWNTRRYDVDITNATGLAIHTVAWTTRDLDVDYDNVKRLSLTLAELQPGGEAAVKDLAKVDGFPVLQEITFDMRGTTIASTEKLMSVEEKDSPPGTYDPPADYTEQPLNAGPPPGVEP